MDSSLAVDVSDSTVALKSQERSTVVPPPPDPAPLSSLSDGHVYGQTYQEQGGYICPSDIFYGRLKRAVNTFGEWKVIVNLPDHFRHDPKYKKYVQTSRLESCV